MSRLFRIGAASLAVVMAASLLNPVAAQDTEKEDKKARKSRVVIRTSKGGKWIGVSCTPVSAAMKAQLGLDNGVLVNTVAAKSPAKDAGVKKFDVITHINGEALKSINGLTKQVNAASDKAIELTVISGGKERIVKIKPTERPAGYEVRDLGEQIRRQIETGDLEKVRELLKDRTDFRILRPGIRLDTPLKVDGGLSVNINKSNDAPAKITVKKGDKTWNVTEDSLDELPDDIRDHVKKMLKGNGGRGFAHGFKFDVSPRIRLDSKKNLKLDTPDFEKQFDKRFRELNKRIEELQKELESIRK